MRQKIPVSDGFLIITRTTSLIFRREGNDWMHHILLRFLALLWQDLEKYTKV